MVTVKVTESKVNLSVDNRAIKSTVQMAKYNGYFRPEHDKPQNERAPSNDSDQPGPSAQSDQTLRCALCGQLKTQTFFGWTEKTLIRLEGCLS